MAMTSLQRGSKGREVGQWQAFLRDRGGLQGPVDGIFGDQTAHATVRFQASRRLSEDGVAGPLTLRAASALGFAEQCPPPEPPRPPRQTPAEPGSDFFPPRPSFPPLRSNAERQQVFGAFAYQPAPTTGNYEAIVITDGWDRENLTSVTVPGLSGIPFGSSSGVSKGRMTFHRKAAPQLVTLWRAWGDAGLLDRIRTFDGAFVARFQRGSNRALSNHAFGSAFDINAHWNPICHPPARIGTTGSVMDLVSIANQHGFYWGGHFSSRGDGMHFEVARVL
jgi:peptidoglycan hydrolase-like protein with peptidoglycan-binding domain